MTRKRAALGLLAVLVLAIIGIVWRYLAVTTYPAPPRVDTPPSYTVAPSVVVTRIGVSMRDLSRALSREVPETVLTIDERVEECVPSEEVRVLGAKILDTPRLGCNLVGEITRGPISVGGSGSQVVARVPLSARIEVRDIGDVIKRETATAAANVTLRARLDVDADWGLRPDVDINYAWTEEPGVDFLGQRIHLQSVADKKIAQMLPEIEAKLARKVRAINVRKEAEKAWQEAFSTVSVNARNPPVWMNITPMRAGVDGLEVAGGEIGVDVMLAGDLTVFVGDRPAAPEPIPLGQNEGASEIRTFDIKVPVLADFEQLEPVLLKALRKLAAKGIDVEDVASFDADFQDVTVYAAEEGRLAVGVTASVTPVGGETKRRWRKASGTVWLTALPVTKPNSEVVTVTDLQVYGGTDTFFGDALVVLLSSEPVRAAIQSELVEDFQSDYDRVVKKALAGMERLKVGQLDFSFELAELSHDRVQVTGKGLFMIVSARGTVRAEIRAKK